MKAEGSKRTLGLSNSQNQGCSSTRKNSDRKLFASPIMTKGCESDPHAFLSLNVARMNEMDKIQGLAPTIDPLRNDSA